VVENSEPKPTLQGRPMVYCVEWPETLNEGTIPFWTIIPIFYFHICLFYLDLDFPSSSLGWELIEIVAYE
jgi:hypothetical protein